MWSLSLVMSECSLSGHGQGHVSSFYIVGLENFRHSKSSVYRWYPQLVRGRFVYDTYRTMEATRSRHGWVNMFITHCPTVTLQLHNFHLFSTCRTNSFCIVAWQIGKISTDMTHRAVPRRYLSFLLKSRPSAILDRLGPYFDHPRWALGGL